MLCVRHRLKHVTALATLNLLLVSDGEKAQGMARSRLEAAFSVSFLYSCTSKASEVSTWKLPSSTSASISKRRSSMLQYSPLPVGSLALDLQPVYACHERNHSVLLLRFTTAFYYCVLLHSPLACGTRSCVRVSNVQSACMRRKITAF